MALIKHHYESIGAFISDAQRQPLNDIKYSRKEGDAAWSGTSSFEEAVSLAHYGWRDGTEKMVKALAAAQPVAMRSLSYSMDVAGAYPLPALAAAGDICSMVNPVEEEARTKPIVKLVIVRNASSSYSGAEMINYGAAVLSYVEALEGAGFRCEIMAGFCTNLKNGACDKSMMTVTLKRESEHIDIDRMAFSLCNPAMLRRLQFAVKESDPVIWPQLGSGYGSPTNVVPGVDTELSQIVIPGINCFDPGSRQLSTPALAAEALAPIMGLCLSEAGIAPPPIVYAREESPAGGFPGF